MLSNKDDMTLIQELIEADLRTRFAMRIRCRAQGHDYEKHGSMSAEGTLTRVDLVCKWCGENKLNAE